MIADCCFPETELYQFLLENDKAFTHPLSESLKERGMNLSQYAAKLARLSTISYELDESKTIKGIVVGYTNNLPEDGGSYITQVVTGMNYRKQGVCGRLLCEYIAFCQNKGRIRYIWMTTGINNIPAQRTYEKAGFTRVPSDKEGLVKYCFRLVDQE